MYVIINPLKVNTTSPVSAQDTFQLNQFAPFQFCQVAILKFLKETLFKYLKAHKLTDIHAYLQCMYDCFACHFKREYLDCIRTPLIYQSFCVHSIICFLQPTIETEKSRFSYQLLNQRLSLKILRKPSNLKNQVLHNTLQTTSLL